MVFNTFIKCQVCGCITRVRLQVGWQEEHPIEDLYLRWHYNTVKIILLILNMKALQRAALVV